MLAKRASARTHEPTGDGVGQGSSLAFRRRIFANALTRKQ